MIGKDVFSSDLDKNIREMLNIESGKQITEINYRLEELQQELLQPANGKKEYEDVTNKIHKLLKLRQDVLTQNVERGGRQQKIEKMSAFLNKHANEPLAYNSS